MAKKWAEVISNPDYKSLSTDEKSELRDEYFRNVVIPKVNPKEHDDVRKSFYSYTEELDPSLSKKPEGIPIYEQTIEKEKSLGDYIPKISIAKPIVDLLTGNTKKRETIVAPEDKDAISKKLKGYASEYREVETILSALGIGDKEKYYGIMRDEKGNILKEQPSEGTTSEILDDPIANAILGAGIGRGLKGASLGIKGTIKEALGGATGGVSDLAIAGGRGAVALAKKPLKSLDNVIEGGIKQGLDDFAKAEPGFKAITGPDEILDLSRIGDSDKFVDAYNYNKDQFRLRDKITLDKIKKGARNAIWGKDENVTTELRKFGDLGERAAALKDLSKGTSAIVNDIMEKANKGIFEGADAKKKNLIEAIAYGRRVQEIEKYRPDVVNTLGTNGADAEKFFERIRSEAPEDFADAWKRVDNVFSTTKNQLKRLRDEGLISEFDFKNLQDKGDYLKREFIQHTNPEISYSFGGKTVTDGGSVIKGLKGGSTEAMNMDVGKLLLDTVNSTENAIVKNRANRALFDFALSNPNNGFVRVAEDAPLPKSEGVIKFTQNKTLTPLPEKTTYDLVKMGEPAIEAELVNGSPRLKAYQKGGETFIPVKIDGETRGVWMKDDSAKEWIGTPAALKPAYANMIQWITGTKILKMMATGINFEFALTNLPRDMALILHSTNEYSPIMPKATVQLVKDLFQTAGDAFFRRGSYRDFLKEGGVTEYLTNQSRVNFKVPGLKEFANFMGYINETSEIWTRLALRKRVMMNQVAQTGVADPMLATHAARDYLDFSKGGSVVKVLDNFIPYLNASVQGTRAMMKGAHKNPGVFTAKIAQLGLFSAGIYGAATANYPEVMKQVSDRDKVNNFIIPLGGLYITDKNGDKRYLTVKIPKDQGQRMFSTLFESLIDIMNGDDVNYGRIKQAIGELMPLSEKNLLPPTINAVMSYVSNKDFWKNEPIWKGADVNPSDEYTKNTPKSFVEFGKVTGMSPERTRGALQKIFTYGNIYTDIIGGGANVILDNAPGEAKEQMALEFLKSAPGTRRFIGLTNPKNEIQGEVDKLRFDENSRRLNLKRDFDPLADKFSRGWQADAMNYIRNAPAEDRPMLIQRLKYNVAGRDVQNKGWYNELRDEPPAVKAKIISKTIENRPEDKMTILKNAKRMGVLDKQTMILINKYRAEGR